MAVEAEAEREQEVERVAEEQAEEARWRPRRGHRPPLMMIATTKPTSKCREESVEIGGGGGEGRAVVDEEAVNVGQDRVRVGEGGWGAVFVLIEAVGLPRCLHDSIDGEELVSPKWRLASWTDWRGLAASVC